MTQRDYLKASSALIEYIHKFCYMLEVQLEGIKSTLEVTVNGVMAEVETINSLSSQSKMDAEKSLEEAYFNPSVETKELFSEIQSIADKILEGGGQESSADDGDVYTRNVLRFGGRYAKHMEALSRIDTCLQGPLSSMMGALSVDDRAMQRIDHVLLSLRAFRISLEYILVDASRRLSHDHAGVLVNDLLSYTWQLYSMAEERKVFLAHFEHPDSNAPGSSDNTMKSTS
jgi:hypothetical protein